MDIVANRVATKSFASSILLQYPTLNALFSDGTMLNTIRLEPLSFLVIGYLTYSNSHLGLGFLHSSTPKQC
jgi:hypothetical protein